MKANKIFAVPRHPIKIGPRAYDGSRLVHMVLCFAKPVDHAVCRGDFGERTLFLGLILVIFMPVFEASDAERIYVSQNQSTTLFVGVILVKGRCFSG